MSQQEEVKRPESEDQSEHEDRDQSKVDAHQIFLKVKASRKRHKGVASGFQELGERMDKIALEQSQLEVLNEIQKLVSQLIEKKQELLQQNNGTVW